MTDVMLTLIDSFDEAQEFMSWLGARRTSAIAVDTETGGFDWWRDPLRLVQIGDATHGWAMRWDRWSGLFEDFVRQYDGRIVMHNFKFDTEFIQANGIPLPLHRIDDTRNKAHLVDPARRTGLKPLADSLMGPNMSAGQDRLGKFFKAHKWDWRSVPTHLNEYWAYAAADTVLTAALDEILDAQLTPARRSLYDVEMAAQIALMKMEVRGARIDLGYASSKGAELRDWADECRAWAEAEYGLNLGSNAQVCEQMIADGWQPKEWTATGKPKFTKEIAEHVDHPLAKLQVKVKHAEKMASAYFDNFATMADGDILHPSINPLGAVTGRMSMTRPALQTLPRDALVRDTFIPRDGNRLVLVDYDAMEVKLTAHFDESGELRAALQREPDIHLFTASQVYGIAIEDVTPHQRQIAKNGIYTTIYGGGSGKLAETVGIPVREAKTFMARFRETYPGVFAFKDSVEREAKRNEDAQGWSSAVTPRGRLQRAPTQQSYKLVNYIIQGSGADVLKTKLAELDMAGFDEYMILPVHDEIVFDVPADLADEVLHDAMEIMHDETWRVPLTVSGKIVNRWGDPYRKAAE